MGDKITHESLGAAALLAAADVHVSTFTADVVPEHFRNNTQSNLMFMFVAVNVLKYNKNTNIVPKLFKVVFMKFKSAGKIGCSGGKGATIAS